MTELRFLLVEWVEEVVEILGSIAPEGVGALPEPQVHPVFFTVPDERPVLTRVNVVMQGEKVALTELENKR